MTLGPFDYVNAINTTKKNLMVDTDDPQQAEEGYVPFLTNRALSYHQDTIMIANLMNQYGGLPKRLQFEFLLNTVRPRKRWGKWTKKTTEDNIEVVKEFYGYSDLKARQAAYVLTQEQIDTMKIKIEKGGIDNGSRIRNPDRGEAE
jgi:hypothetical protein